MRFLDVVKTHAQSACALDKDVGGFPRWQRGRERGRILFLLSVIIAGRVQSRLGRFQGGAAILRNPTHFTSFK